MSLSFWDKYLAPGDLRQQRHLSAQASLAADQDEKTSSGKLATEPIVHRIPPAQRARRQNALLYGGLTFTILSLIITRRALRRKHLAVLPKSDSTTSSAQPPKVDGGLEAVEALGLATLNVFSIAMASIGGFMKYFDVADVEDMRDQVRRSIGYDVYGGDSAADKELEAWVADVLSRKDAGLEPGLKEGIAEKLAALEKKDREAGIWKDRVATEARR